MKKLAIALVAVLFFSIGVWFSLTSKTPQAPLDIAGIHLPTAKPIDDFMLQNSQQQRFDREQLKGQWTFMYFGYTYCPDACPLALTKLNVVDKRLSEQNADQDIAYLLVSVDPRRDTLDRLAEYTGFFNAKFRGATGDVSEIDRLTKSLGIYYSVPEQPNDPENYLVDHSSVIVLTNPDGQLQALFSAPHDPDQISSDFLAIRERWQNS